MQNDQEANIENSANDYFARVPKRLLEDPTVSPAAKGIAAYLLGKPANWIAHVKDIENHMACGEEVVRRALLELRRHGYALLVRVNKARGRVAHWRYKLSDSPVYAKEPANKELAIKYLRKCAAMKEPPLWTKRVISALNHQIGKTQISETQDQCFTDQCFTDQCFAGTNKKEGIVRRKGKETEESAPRFTTRMTTIGTAALCAAPVRGPVSRAPAAVSRSTGKKKPMISVVIPVEPEPEQGYPASNEAVKKLIPAGMNPDDLRSVLSTEGVPTLLRLWVGNYKAVFGREIRCFTPQDLLGAMDLMMQGMSVENVFAAIVLAWNRCSVTELEAHDPFWACHHYTRTLAELAHKNRNQHGTNFDRILTELDFRCKPAQVDAAWTWLDYVRDRRNGSVVEAAE